MYNGRSHSLVDAATGSAWAAITAAANGIITRGVLLDIARVRDVPWLEPGQGVFPDDLEEAERRQDVRVRSGDAVLLRIADKLSDLVDQHRKDEAKATDEASAAAEGGAEDPAG